MQRVVSINLSGNAYQVEENGYNALFAYLDAMDASLQESSDRVEKLADLERVLAEKCQACLGPHKSVVTSAEIDRILVELGAAAPPPPNRSSASSSSSTSSPSSSSTATSSTQGAPFHRRLYQVREGAMIGGVCVGLSEFLHMDVTLIRILFVVFALVTSGWGLLAYGVLMFVVPKVDTRAEASGGPAAGAHPPHSWPWEGGWPWDRYGWPWDHPTPEQQKAREQEFGAKKQEWQDKQQAWRDSRQQWRDERRQWREERRAARMAYGPHPHPFGTFMMIVFLMMGFFWLSFWTRGNFFFGWPFFWGFPHWIGIIVFFMFLRLIFMPWRASRWYGYGPYGPNPHYAWASMWNGFAWFMVMIFAVWLAYRYIPEIHDMIRGFDNSLSLGTWHV